MVYLLHYFYNLKTRGDFIKLTPDSESASKNPLYEKKKNFIKLNYYRC